MKPDERSKELFQRYSQLRGYTCSCLPESHVPGVRSPDLEVCIGGLRVIAENKDLRATDKEANLWRQTRAGKIVAHGREIGKRARSLIESARGQLRSYAEQGIPTIVVLYDNLLVDGTRPTPSIDLFGPTGPTDIDVALYGFWQANVRISSTGETQSLGDTRSRWRLMNDREIISAVLVIYEHTEKDDLFVIVYHNYWARIPLSKSAFRGPHDCHLAKPSNPDLKPTDWVRI